MDKAVSQYDIGLDKTQANYVPLSPISFLARSAHVYPNLTSVVHEQQRFTWAQTYERSRRFASWLAAQGIRRGDTVERLAPMRKAIANKLTASKQTVPHFYLKVRANISAIITETGAAGVKDMGKVMAALKERYAGQMDFAKASATVKELLN